MIDPVAASLLAFSSSLPTATVLIFFAGLITSIGPCVAPRYIAVAAIANGYQRPLVPTVAFVVGLITAMMLVGFGAGLVGSLWRLSTLAYALLATCLVGGGCMTILRAGSAGGLEDACCSSNDRSVEPKSTARRSVGAVFLVGATSAFVVSPCCTPVIAAVVATSTAIGEPLSGLVLLASFALGHALPLFFTGSVLAVAGRTFRGRISPQAPAIVTGTLMIALGAYDGMLV